MAHSHKISLSIIIIFISSWTHLFLSATGSADPVPTPWPPQFHSILYMNTTSGKLQITDLWYDYPNGRNFNIIQKQLGKKLYDLEWDNGTSYYYTLDANKECTVRHFSVGILRPNWLSGAQYLGRVVKDGFLCDAWTKVDFIWYYEDVVTKRPVSWTFYTGMVAHVMTFEVGKVLDDPGWQAPVYCFDGANKDEESMLESSTEFPVEGPFMRDVTSTFAI